MRKNKPQIPITEEQQYEGQYRSWLNDSHYWIEQESHNHICKWCGKWEPICSDSSTLCMKNPEILRILSYVDNPTKKLET
jgi:hypothetical protein